MLTAQIPHCLYIIRFHFRIEILDSTPRLYLDLNNG